MARPLFAFGVWTLDCSHYGCQGYGLSCPDAPPTPDTQCRPRARGMTCVYAGDAGASPCASKYKCTYTGTFFDWVEEPPAPDCP